MSDWSDYQKVFCQRAHQLLAWAYADVRHRLNSDMNEPVITGLLSEAIDVRLQSPDTPETYQHYHVDDQPPVSPHGEAGKNRLLLDIRIGTSDLRPNPRFIFEAKRLKTGGFPIGKYTGEEGMGAFLSGDYGKGHPEAAMIGLVQNKDVSYWHGELHRSFEQDGGSLKIQRSLSSISIISDIKDELVSVHLRHDVSTIHIFHVFLICTPITGTVTNLPSE